MRDIITLFRGNDFLMRNGGLMMKIKVYIKQPGRPPYSTHIENSLKNLQNTVGGYIETVTLGDDWTIICNEEGRIKGLPYNCTVCGVSFVGTIVFAGVKGDEFEDIPISFKDFKSCFRKLWE